MLTQQQQYGRYAGFQTYLKVVASDGCLLLSLLSIIEDVNKKVIDFQSFVQTVIKYKWFDANDGTVLDSLSILNHYTHKKWGREIVSKLPSKIGKKEYTIEKWYNPRTKFTHFKRRYVDTLIDSVTVKEGSIIEYYIYRW